MSHKALINAFNALAEAAALVAIELEATEQPPAASAPQAAAVSGAGATASASAPVDTPVDQGECPKHHRPWKVGKFGPFCSQPTDDPAWGKERGDKTWCSINPSNAPKWLEIHRGMAA